MRTLFVVFLLSIVPVRMAEAQQTITDVLSFLMTNRSIPTDDFVRDEQAAIATSNTIANLFVLELASLPSSSAAGFTYRLDPALGTPIRTSQSFGPIFTQRSLLAGQNHASFGVSYRSTNFTNIDGRSLRDGTLLSTASILRGDTAPFDIETVSLRIRTDTMTITGSYGINGWTRNPPEDIIAQYHDNFPTAYNYRGPDVQGAWQVPLFLDCRWPDGWMSHEYAPPQTEDEPTWARYCINRHDGAVTGLFMDWSVRKIGVKELWTQKWHRRCDTRGPWTKAGGVELEDWPAWMRRFKEY